MNKLEGPITERRRQTRNSIYQYLFFSETSHSKLEISSDLSLSLPTVHQNLTELMEAGLIRRDGTFQSTGGRRAMRLTIEESARYAVGVSITDNGLYYIAADLRMREIAYKRIGYLPADVSEGLGRVLSEELEVFLDENGLDRARLLGVGVTLPALIDQEEGRVTLAPTLHLRDIKLEDITRYIKYPFSVSNDATSAGYAEWFSAPEQRNMAYLFLESGVGGAVLLNGAPYTGVHQRSGEFGHMCVAPNGLLCKCGKRGCLEAYVSTSRINDNLGITPADFFKALNQGNEEYRALWLDTLGYLAIGINNIRMALDCDVVLGGFVTQFMQPWLPELRRLVGELDPFEDGADYITLCRYPKRAGTLGAALYYIKGFIESI